MRGTLHLLPAAEAACYLSLLAAARIWVKPTWQRAFGATPQEVEQLVKAVSAILDGQVLTRDELVRALVSDRRFASMEQQLRSGWGALLKPLAWQGALCYGPTRGKSVTFTSPASLVKRLGWCPRAGRGCACGHRGVSGRLRSQHTGGLRRLAVA